MIKRKLPYFLQIPIVYLICLGPLMGTHMIINQTRSYSPNFSDSSVIIVIYFLVLLMTKFGFYILSFFYGLYFQVHFRIPLSKIALSSGIVLVVTTILCWPVWRPDVLVMDYKVKYLVTSAFFQSLSFFAGGMLVLISGYLRNKKTNKL